MRVPKHATQLLAIQHLMYRRRIGLIARRSELLSTEPALAARNTEAVHNAVSDFPVFDCTANGLDDAAELVAQDVAGFCLDDHAM
jgi:hypothetical protein